MMSDDEVTVVERLETLAEAAMSDEVNMGLRDVIRQVKECINTDMPDCVHCGSPFTFRRASDGDVACKDCPGIMPDDPDINTGACPDCGSYDTRTNPAEPATGYTGQPDDAVVRVCEACNGENLIVTQDADRRIEA